MQLYEEKPPGDAVAKNSLRINYRRVIYLDIVVTFDLPLPLNNQ